VTYNFGILDNIFSYFWPIFSARRSTLGHATAKGHFVCLSPHPSITLVIHAYMVQDIEILFTQCDTVMFLVC